MPIHLNLTAVSGLSAAEAATRLREEGPNELPSSKPRSVFGIAISVATEPMFLLLVACGVLYLLLGDVEEALMLLGFVFVIIGITFYQERKTERALEALRDLSSPRAAVIRDGQLLRIPGREVVRGDVIMLAEGDRVPADAVMLDSLSLATDESLLTGESVPVRKVARSQRQATDMGRPGGDDLPFVFSGSLVVQGQGLAETLATGSQTELGKIGKALQRIEDQQSPLKREIGRFPGSGSVAGRRGVPGTLPSHWVLWCQPHSARRSTPRHKTALRPGNSLQPSVYPSTFQCLHSHALHFIACQCTSVDWPFGYRSARPAPAATP